MFKKLQHLLRSRHTPVVPELWLPLTDNGSAARLAELSDLWTMCDGKWQIVPEDAATRLLGVGGIERWLSDDPHFVHVAFERYYNEFGVYAVNPWATARQAHPGLLEFELNPHVLTVILAEDLTRFVPKPAADSHFV